MSSVRNSIQTRSNAIAQEAKAILADTYLLYLKTQGCHWNVQGPRFYFLHLLFEEQYKELADAVDTIAEKIRSLKEDAPASFEEFRLLSGLQEYRLGMSEETMLKELAEDHERIIQHCAQAIELCMEASDQTTADLLIERSRAHEKMAWMLRSHFR